LYLWPRRLPIFFIIYWLADIVANLTRASDIEGEAEANVGSESEVACHTEFAIAGLSLMDCVWKLKGLRDPAGGGGPSVVSELKDGVPRPAEDGMGEVMDPKRPGKVSDRGERELES